MPVQVGMARDNGGGNWYLCVQNIMFTRECDVLSQLLI